MGTTKEHSGAGRLAAVVVTHDRRAMLRIGLERLLASPPGDLAHLVVVDNASTDGTGAWLAGLADPRLTVLTAPQNLGGAGGFAIGLRHATEVLGADWVVVMDDDARPAEGALARFHAAPRDGRAAWAAAVHGPDGALCDMNRPSQNPFWHASKLFGTVFRGRNGFHLSDAQARGPARIDVDAASFVGLFLSREAIRRAGYPDARLFLYGDDVHYTLGLRRAGGRIAFDPALVFEHDCRSTAPGQKVFAELWRAYFHHRNLLLVYRRAAGPLFWPVALAVSVGWFRLARHYGARAPAFRRLLRRAIRDGVAQDLSLGRAEVQALAEAPAYSRFTSSRLRARRKSKPKSRLANDTAQT